MLTLFGWRKGKRSASEADGVRTTPVPGKNGKAREPNVRELLDDLPNVFTPASPISHMDYLQGRTELLDQIDEVLHRRGAHLIVYGERGVGKTSLAWIAAQQLRGYRVIYCCMNTNVGFEASIGAVLCELQEDKTATKVHTGKLNAKEAGLDGIIQVNVEHEEETIEVEESFVKTSLTPNEVARRMAGHRVLVILDDYERVSNADTHVFCAELIKGLSNRGSHATLMLVGIAESANGLLAGHCSLARHVSAIHVPRLEDEQIRAIAETGFQALRLQYEPALLDKIVRYSANFPFFTHRICEGLVRTYLAQARGGKRTDWMLRECDMRGAIRRTIREIMPEIRDAYDEAVGDMDHAPLVQYVVAMGDDSVERKDILVAVNAIEKHSDGVIDNDLKRMTEKGLLIKPETGHYRFVDPFQRAYTILRFRDDAGDDRLRQIDAALEALDRNAPAANTP
jgi:hypothetical protein